MDYPFENLSPETFQEFTQALLVKERPNVQCFPVAQPDGGRDAVSFVPTESRLEFVMYQVKFVRKPFAKENPHTWLVGILEEEAPKLALQIPKGAREFVLITNVPGTAHPEAGSIDKAQAILRKHIPLPSTVWWRDDLNRRLDNAWDLKWVYPQLMAGPDLLRLLIESRLTEERERRSDTVRAFLVDQYALDEEVKFRQVELQNRLLDLFIDVPVVPLNAPAGRRHLSRYAAYHQAVMRESQREAAAKPRSDDELAGHRLSDRSQIGAATLLLDAVVQSSVPYAVLEGAPGQGKSTISQYVAQVHRMRLLNRAPELAAIPVAHRVAPVRLPFKVDLRDFAVWLSRKDPFSPGDDAQPAEWQKSLESFLSALVRHHSGGAAFSIPDLQAVSKSSALLVILDGLDEVADFQRRRDVVEEVVKGVRRLKEVSVGIQVVVTSRPAAFANSPGMPEEQFQYFQLDAVTKPLIDTYTERWLKARKLQGRERSDVKRIIREKLDQPHLRDLARNPMQLAILLSLIHSKGASLPDKRTALYDSYIELFFSRESEKSSVVREHRDLLVDIHRYLAWTLHAEAERGPSSGSISRERLESVVTTYLATEGHDSSLVGDLFTGVVERVVALVSRVEGTYEFEVQPLREYFAARYLYETAPYSPPGNERGGTKPDRFDALARNFYWLNVARFFAGCFSKGELPALVDRLEELVKSEDYARLLHPRLLASTLLNDWVFAQHPRSVKEVVALVLDAIGLRILSTSERGGQTAFTLPSKNGREDLVERCFAILRSAPANDYQLALVRVLQANSSPDELLADWIAQVNHAFGPDLGRWIEMGVTLGTLPRLHENEVLRIASLDGWSDRTLHSLLEARRWDILSHSETILARVVDMLLESSGDLGPRNRKPVTGLERFAQTLAITRYGVALIIPQPFALREIWKRHALSGEPRAASDAEDASTALPSRCDALSRVAEREATKSARTWATELSPWNRVAEEFVKQFGDKWWLYHFATIAAGIRSATETSAGHGRLFDEQSPICERARYARLRAGNSAWWERTLGVAETDADRMFAVLLLIAWGSKNTISNLTNALDEILVTMNGSNWERVYIAARNSLNLRWGGVLRRGSGLSFEKTPKVLSYRMVTLLSLRATPEWVTKVYREQLSDYSGDDPIILGLCESVAVSRLTEAERIDPTPHLKMIRRAYFAGAAVEEWNFQRILHRSEYGEFPLHVAHLIADDPERYPAFVVTAAEKVCQGDVATRIRPLGQIAEEEGWTFS